MFYSPRGYSAVAPEQVSVNSRVALSTTIHNSSGQPVSYVAIYQIVDSSGYTLVLEQVDGQLAGAASDSAVAYWSPDASGAYQVKALVVTAMDAPKLLMPAWTADVEATDKAGAEVTQVISGYGSIGNPSPAGAQPLPSLAQLQDYTLKRINQDRASFGLNAVKLSSNPAAQAHANEMLRTGVLSHWTVDGMKPYMSYTVMGGLGYVAQNVAGGTICSGCPLTANAIYQKINASEYGLLNNDGECCGDLHRNNILDPFHTDVSIGIAYDNDSLYMVENFENNYISYDRPITTDNKTITVSGKTQSGVLSQVMIYFDDPPAHKTYVDNQDVTTYDPGEFVGGVVNDASDYGAGQTINATRWQNTPSSIDLSFDMSPIMIRPGVYTIYMFFDDGKSDRFVVSSYSVFHS